MVVKPVRPVTVRVGAALVVCAVRLGTRRVVQRTQATAPPAPRPEPRPWTAALTTARPWSAQACQRRRDLLRQERGVIDRAA